MDASMAPVGLSAKPRPAWVTVASAMVFPLFFVIMFSLCYVSAFHAPSPHGAPIDVVGSSELTSSVADGIEKQAGGAFDVTTTTSRAVAANAVEQRSAIGAVVVGATQVEAIVATGAGPITSSTVETLAKQLQAQEQEHVARSTPDGAGTAPSVGLKVTDVAPLASKDAVGTGLFYFFIICTIAGYLTVTVLAQIAARMHLRLRSQYLAVAIAAVLAPPIAFALSSLFIGAYGLHAAGVFGLLGIGAFYTLTVGAVSLLATLLAGRGAIFLVLTLGIFLNFPSAGGAIPYTFLPGFWQGVHSFWFGAGSMEAMRDLVYFSGAGMWPWLVHTAIWLVATVGLTAVLGLRRAPHHAPGAHSRAAAPATASAA